MTEEEAKTKWCPFTRVVVNAENYSNGNRFENGHRYNEQALCIGSACMAWRELHPRESREDHSGGSAIMAKRAVETNRIARREGGPGSLGRWVIDAVGFCGLAGKP